VTVLAVAVCALSAALWAVESGRCLGVTWSQPGK